MESTSPKKLHLISHNLQKRSAVSIFGTEALLFFHVFEVVAGTTQNIVESLTTVEKDGGDELRRLADEAGQDTLVELQTETK